MKYCDKCGAEMLDEAVMCVKCGNMVSAEGKSKEMVYNERYCTKCGAKVFQETVVCPHCGCPMENANVGKGKEKNKGIDIAIKVLLILTIVGLAFCGFMYLISLIGFSMMPDIGATPEEMSYVLSMLIVMVVLCLPPLAWVIPMSIIILKKMKNKEPIGVGLKICTLIFVNTIAGILLLCKNED